MNAVVSEVVIKRAEICDIGQMIGVCRQAFPRSLLWQNDRRLARQWWNVVLSSKAVENWVLREAGEIVALSVLILDEARWAREQPLRRGPLRARMLAALRHPLLAACRIARLCTSRLKPVSETSYSVQLPTDWGPAMRTWLALIATRSDKRGKGYAGCLLEKCVLRTARLGRRAIALRVACDNTGAKALYKKHGYLFYISDAKGKLYVRFLNINPDCQNA